MELFPYAGGFAAINTKDMDQINTGVKTSQYLNTITCGDSLDLMIFRAAGHDFTPLGDGETLAGTKKADPTMDRP